MAFVAAILAVAVAIVLQESGSSILVISLLAGVVCWLFVDWVQSGGSARYRAGVSLQEQIQSLNERLDQHRAKILELMQRLDAAAPSEAAAPKPPVAPPARSLPAQAAVEVEANMPATGMPLARDLQPTADTMPVVPETPPAPRPAQPSTPPIQPRPPISAAAEEQGTEPALWTPLGWFISGNPLAKIGVLLLFFGLAFLFKYAADHDAFPIQIRLTAAAFGAGALLVVGWHQRLKPGIFGLLLQGAGIGALYITIYAAFALGLLPQGPVFAMMLIVCAAAVVLAVLQNAQSLAVAASLGGFLAPVLLATGGGSHIVLFSYYLMLSVGILAVSLFQSWRSLNLIGFFFVFSVGSRWGFMSYTPQLYPACQAFLLAFVLLYSSVALLFALRQPLEKLRGFVDSTLVFGTPLVGFGMQYGLTRHWAFGPAFSALGFAALYLPLAWALRRWRPDAGRMLVQAFIALGAGFVSLAIPLGLNARWTALSWALESVGVIWFALVQQRRRSLWCGLALQALASVALLRFFALGEADLVSGLTSAVAVALAALLGGRLLYGYRDQFAENLIASRTLFGLGMAWSLFAVLWGADRGVAEVLQPATVLLSIALAAVICYWAGQRWRWPPLMLACCALWLAAALCGLWLVSQYRHLFINGFTSVALFGSLATGVGLLRWARFPEQLSAVLHTVGVWLLFAGLLIESDWALNHWQILSAGPHHALLLALLPAACVGIIDVAFRRHWWPVSAQASVYALQVPLPLLVAVVGWLLFGNFSGGVATLDGHALVYLPLLNFIDLGAVAAFLALVTFWRRQQQVLGTAVLEPAQRRIACGVLLFWWGNGMLLRTLAQIDGIAWTADDLFDSRLVQTSIALVWAATALGLMWWAARRHWRKLWMAGAALALVVVAKLFLVDSAASGGLARALAFIGVAVLLLVVGYVAPLPPKAEVKP